MSTKHNDDDPVIFRWTSNLNISFDGRDEFGYTWGEWRAMSHSQRVDALTQILWQIADVEALEDDSIDDAD